MQAMAEVEEGEEITLEMKKAGIKNYVEIIRTASDQVERAEEEDGDDASGRVVPEGEM